MDNIDNRNLPSRDNCSNSSDDYLMRASSAVDAGDKILGMHLYMAAFERAKNESFVPSDKSLEGMEKAWLLAVETHQRSLAEYIFEMLEPYWTADEMARHADQLQRLALDKLEEFGLSREALEGMAEMVNQDMLDAVPELMCHFEDSELAKEQDQEVQASSNQNNEAQVEKKDSSSFNEHQITNAVPAPPMGVSQIIIPSKKKSKKENTEKQSGIQFNYDSISGFDSVINKMGKLGIGRDKDPEFRNFISMLNKRHGVSQMPGVGTLIFSSPSREDANYFMVATVGEMKIPAVRMRLDYNAQGQPVLCIMASSDFKTRISNLSRIGFNTPTVLILEDLDLWNLPVSEVSLEEPKDLLQAQISRGAREAVALIRMALESPEVTVFISASHPEDIEGYYLDGLDQYRVIDIDLPNTEERKAVWRSAQDAHPSLRGLDVAQMAEFSSTMSRFEIFAVTTEAVEHAYKKSLEEERFVAVHTDDIVARLSNFQPLESEEYQKMEELVVDDFRKTLDSLEDILGE